MGSKIVIFSTCKPLEGIYEYTQHNAVTSWLRLGFDVVLVGREAVPLCNELGVEYGGEVDRCDDGYPLMDSVFDVQIDSGLVMYVNADILLTDTFASLVVPHARPDTFVTGIRMETEVDGYIDFDCDWVSPLDPQYEKPHARDYFIFRNGLFDFIPPFSMGHYSWDTWLQHAAKRLVKLKDVTSKKPCAIHQIHEKYKKSHVSDRNRELRDEYTVRG